MSAAVQSSRPLVFVYDRNAARSHQVLDLRLLGCRNTAMSRGWEIAGTWIDTGNAALDDMPALRPRFMDMVQRMTTEAAHRPVFCLVHNWDRLSRISEQRLAFQRHIAGAGGFVVTTFAESDEGSRAALTRCSRA